MTKIERLYGRLEGLKLPRKLQLNLERDNLLKSTHASNSIEGNPLSYPEVTNLLLDNRVPVNRDEKEIKNYFELLKQMDDYVGLPLNIDVILNWHKHLMMGVDDSIAGVVRDSRVVVGNYKLKGDKVALSVKHEPPAHDKSEILGLLEELFQWENSTGLTQGILKAGIFHHQFVYIHPFVDGNGRMCRLLTALIFMKSGYLINKYFVLDDYYDVDRQQYSDMLHSADSGDKTRWLEYFAEGVTYSLQSALAKAENAFTTLPIHQRLSSREQEVLGILQSKKEITSDELARQLEVSRQQAHKLLSSLVEKGLLSKKGSTKASFYELL